MEGKGRFIFPVLISGQMVLLVTGVATLINLGLRSDFLLQWLTAFLIAWPVAATAAFFAIPVARRATQRLLVLPGRSQ